MGSTGTETSLDLNSIFFIRGEDSMPTNPDWTIEIRDGKVYIKYKGKYTMKCPLCGGELVPHQILTVHRPYKGWALDVTYKCSNCELVQWFGIPITEEEARQLTPYRRQWLTHIWEEIEEEKIKKRLESWGYW